MQCVLELVYMRKLFLSKEGSEFTAEHHTSHVDTFSVHEANYCLAKL